MRVINLSQLLNKASKCNVAAISGAISYWAVGFGLTWGEHGNGFCGGSYFLGSVQLNELISNK